MLLLDRVLGHKSTACSHKVRSHFCYIFISALSLSLRVPFAPSCTQLTLFNLVFCTQYVDVFITFRHSIHFLRFYTSPHDFSFVYHPRGQFRVARAQASGQSQSWGSEGRPLLPCLVLVPVLSALGLGGTCHTLNW